LLLNANKIPTSQKADMEDTSSLSRYGQKHLLHWILSVTMFHFCILKLESMYYWCFSCRKTKM